MGVPVVSGKKQESDPTMTHHQSALTTLISEVLADPDLAHSDVFRGMLQAGLQDLVDAEATARIGAAPHERTPERISAAEKAANGFALDALFGDAGLQPFKELSSDRDIAEMARRIGVSPGVAVHQMHRRRMLDYDRGNRLFVDLSGTLEG